MAVCGLAGQPEQALGVVLQQPAGLGERAVARRAVEQSLPQLILDAAHRLADGRLRPVETPRGGGKTAVSGHRQERGEVRQLHKPN